MKSMSLHVENTATGERQFVVIELPAVVGRSEDCDLALDDIGVSREHLQFHWCDDEKALQVKDLGSANGTYLEGKIFNQITLTETTAIGLGKYQLHWSPHQTAIAKVPSEPHTATGVHGDPTDIDEICQYVRQKIGEQNLSDTVFEASLPQWVDESIAECTTDAAEVQTLRKKALAQLTGYGPIQTLIEDSNVNEIMVNGPSQIYIEKLGQLTKCDVQFSSEASLRTVVQRIVTPLGRRIDEASPTVDARLPDGSRVHAVIPPIALNGTVLTIRKFRQQHLTVDTLVAGQSLTEDMAVLLKSAVKQKKNVVVSGGTGAGKTTLLNILSSFIGDGERIVTIEDSAELQLSQQHVVKLEARPPNSEGAGAVSIRELVRNALRMRPDRVVVGECRGAEALDMLQSMNTGHDGSLTTVHANAPRDAVARIETMCLMAGLGLPHAVIRQQIVRAVDFIVQQSRLADGSRKITEIAELQRLEGETPVLQSLWRFDRTANTFVSTGFHAQCLQGN